MEQGLTSGAPLPTAGVNTPAKIRFVVMLIFVVAFCFGGATFADQFTLKVIAINDFHGNLQPPGTDPHLPNVPAGGIDVLAGYVRYLKNKKSDYSVVVSAGDLIGASPLISNLFHDEATIETMNRLGLEISSVGNHEFDKGRDELQRLQNGGCFAESDQNSCRGEEAGTPIPFEGAKFTYLAANVIDETTNQPILPAYIVKKYQGVPVAFIGLTLQDTPTKVTHKGVAGLRFEDEAHTINDIVSKLKVQGIQSFIVLIHQGAESDNGAVHINACDAQVKGSSIETIVNQLDDAVDLVISGHTHATYICRIANNKGREVLVTSAGSYGRVITDIDVSIDTGTRKITGAKAKNVVVDRRTKAMADRKISPDVKIKEIVDRYAGLAKSRASKVVATIDRDFKSDETNKASNQNKGNRKKNKNSKNEETIESSLGDLIADAQLEATRTSGAQVAFMNPGGIREDLLRSSQAMDGRNVDVTYGQLFSIQPFGNTLVTMTLTGSQIRVLLEEQFNDCNLGFPMGRTGRKESRTVLQVSNGFTYTWDPAAPACNKIDPDSIKIEGKTVVPTQAYRVTVNSFLAGGGDEFYELTRGRDPVGVVVA